MAPSDNPPAYSRTSQSGQPSSPLYTAIPDDSERTLRHGPVTPNSPDSETFLGSVQSNTEFIYSNKHIELNLGPKLWGTKSPSYGLNGVVECQLTLLGELARVSSVIVKLEGRVTTTVTERGLISGAANTTILENTVTLTPTASGEWLRQHALSFPFPTYVRGGTSPLPPTFTAYHPGATCEIKYWLRVTLVRKGLRRNDQMKVTILYLPRTFARGLCPQFIPNVIADCAAPTPDILDIDEVSVIQLNPSWRHDQPCRPGSIPPTVFLAIPAVHSFASHEAIPLTLSVVSRNAPALTKILAPMIRIQLVKRTKFWINNGRQSTKNDSTLCSADILGIDESREGVCVINCELPLNRFPLQQSWAVENVSLIQHYIRVVVQPPASVADHVPSFEHTVAIELTTDTWDSPERVSMGAGETPSPAIRFETTALDRAGSSSSAVQCARSTYMGLR